MIRRQLRQFINMAQVPDQKADVERDNPQLCDHSQTLEPGKQKTWTNNSYYP